METIERHLKRESLNDYLRIFYNNKLSAHLINISEKGIMTISDLPFMKSECYNLQIMLPVSFKAIENNAVQRYVHLNVICKWSKKSHKEDLYFFSGFTISNIDDINLKLLNILIEDYKM